MSHRARRIGIISSCPSILKGWMEVFVGMHWDHICRFHWNCWIMGVYIGIVWDRNNRFPPFNLPLLLISDYSCNK